MPVNGGKRHTKLLQNLNGTKWIQSGKTAYIDFNVKENKMKEFDYKAYVTDNWLLKEAVDSNNQELQVGDSVMVKGRKGTYGPTEVTGFAQGGDEQYVKISGIEIDGKFTTMVGEWQVEKVMD